MENVVISRDAFRQAGFLYMRHKLHGLKKEELQAFFHALPFADIMAIYSELLKYPSMSEFAAFLRQCALAMAEEMMKLQRTDDTPDLEPSFEQYKSIDEWARDNP